MIGMGLTTWAESPEPSRSDSHAWSAHPTYDLLTIVAGIAPESAGFKSVRIEPHLSSLQQLTASLAHSDGNIGVRYEREAAGLRATIDLPHSLTGTFLWQGKTYPLHGGHQQFLLPQQAVTSQSGIAR
jgi:hypothetical protein